MKSYLSHYPFKTRIKADFREEEILARLRVDAGLHLEMVNVSVYNGENRTANKVTTDLWDAGSESTFAKLLVNSE